MIEWLRAARVTLTKAASRNAKSGTQYVIDGLRISFSVENHILPPQPTIAEINVYNLSAETRAKIEARDFGKVYASVILEVGYKEKSESEPIYGVIFSGNVRSVDHVKKGADWLTKIQSGDGERGWRSLTNHSFACNTELQAVIKKIAADMDVDIGNLNAAIGKGLTGKKVFASGLVVQGKAADILTGLLDRHGYNWTIHHGELLLYPQKGAESSGDAVVISPETGLIGSPESGAPELNRRRSTLKVECLLNHLIVPGKRVSLYSSTFNGAQFTPTAIHHSGDTYGDEWKTAVQLRGT